MFIVLLENFLAFAVAHPDPESKAFLKEKKANKENRKTKNKHWWNS